MTCAVYSNFNQFYSSFSHVLLVFLGRIVCLCLGFKLCNFVSFIFDFFRGFTSIFTSTFATFTLQPLRLVLFCLLWFLIVGDKKTVPKRDFTKFNVFHVVLLSLTFRDSLIFECCNLYNLKVWFRISFVPVLSFVLIFSLRLLTFYITFFHQFLLFLHHSFYSLYSLYSFCSRLGCYWAS